EVKVPRRVIADQQFAVGTPGVQDLGIFQWDLGTHLPVGRVAEVYLTRFGAARQVTAHGEALAVGREERLTHRLCAVAEVVEFPAGRGFPDVDAPVGHSDQHLAVGTEHRPQRYAVVFNAAEFPARPSVPNDNGALDLAGLVP